MVCVKFFEDAMVTPEQIRMARAALNWSVKELAGKCGIGVNTLSRLENGTDSRLSTLSKIQKTLINAGIVFLSENENGVGIRYSRLIENDDHHSASQTQKH